MKMIIKLILAIIMPNFGIALLIKNMVKDSEEEDKVQTTIDIQSMYFLSCAIVVLPVIAYILLCIFDKLNTIEAYKTITKSSLFVGIIISVAYLKSTKVLKTEK
jgi:hypothetical protein